MAEHLGKGGELEARGALAGSIPGMCLAPAPAPPPAGGKGLSCTPGEMRQREFIFLGGQEPFLAAFPSREILGKPLGALQSCPR